VKRYPKSNADEPIQLERISGVEMLDPMALMPGDSRWVRVSISRLKDDPEVVVWGSARVMDVEDFE
jgi:hypothetical protein